MDCASACTVHWTIAPRLSNVSCIRDMWDGLERFSCSNFSNLRISASHHLSCAYYTARGRECTVVSKWTGGFSALVRCLSVWYSSVVVQCTQYLRRETRRRLLLGINSLLLVAAVLVSNRSGLLRTFTCCIFMGRRAFHSWVNFRLNFRLDCHFGLLF